MEPTLTRFEGFEGIHLVADVWGDDDAWPVLLMHGGGQTRHAWGGTAKTLAANGWRAVSLDLRGHGDSEWALNGDYSFTAYANDADRGGRPARQAAGARGRVARRRGARSSPRAAPTASCRAGSWSSTSPTGRIPRASQRIHDFMSSGLGGFATLDDAAEAIAAYTPNRKKRVNPAGLMKVLRQKPDGRWYWHWDPAFIDRGRKEVPAADFQGLFEAALSNIRVPTLLVRGLLSDVVTEEGTQEFLDQIPGSKLVDVGDAAHMVAGDQNDAFSAAVVEFLEHDVRPTLPTSEA